MTKFGINLTSNQTYKTTTSTDKFHSYTAPPTQQPTDSITDLISEESTFENNKKNYKTLWKTLIHI